MMKLPTKTRLACMACRQSKVAPIPMDDVHETRPFGCESVDVPERDPHSKPFRFAFLTFFFFFSHRQAHMLPPFVPISKPTFFRYLASMPSKSTLRKIDEPGRRPCHVYVHLQVDAQYMTVTRVQRGRFGIGSFAHLERSHMGDPR